MSSLSSLKSHSDDIAAAIGNLTRCLENGDGPEDLTRTISLNTDPASDAQQAKRDILAGVGKIRKLLWDPTDLLQHLGIQTEFLSCLRWLGEFQILACIPLTGSVPICDIADLAGVPLAHLRRIIRLTATQAFLSESPPESVAHTQLSASFVTNPTLLDASMFLAELVAPSALHMAPTTQRFGDSSLPDASAFNLALDTSSAFHVIRQETPKLDRQWCAYLENVAGLHEADSVAYMLPQMLPQLGTLSVNSAYIVEVGAQSTSASVSLAALYPALHFIVQIRTQTTVTSRGGLSEAAPWPSPGEHHSRVTVTYRAPGSRQTVMGGAIYILHLHSLAPDSILAELQAHLGVLRTNFSVMLVMTARLLPQPGSMSHSEAESVARSRDLAMLQLANEGEMELVGLLKIINSVTDSCGGLVVTRALRSQHQLVNGLVVKYQMA
ncbi:hypothetical protein HD806DRAFT_511971 [Xylariaceae sp. AK1471]|nr:hypothetical protein HD806DRAFT_511971 [Xylariaceae sp. AK1471]